MTFPLFKVAQIYPKVIFVADLKQTQHELSDS